MTHDPTHTLFLGAGAIYFAFAMYFALRNYQMTGHDGYWFFMTLFSASMLGVMTTGLLWSAGIAGEEAAHPYYDTLFLIAAIFLFSGAYTLSKKHHKVKVF